MNGATSTTDTPTRTATFIRAPRWGRGDMRLYRLSPPLSSEPWGDEPAKAYEYVIVSAAVVPYSGPETYIFGADADGKDVIDWSEMPGSYKGGLDHEAALRLAGYEVSR